MMLNIVSECVTKQMCGGYTGATEVEIRQVFVTAFRHETREAVIFINRKQDFDVSEYIVHTGVKYIFII